MGIGLGEGLLLLLIAALFLKGDEIGTVARKLGNWMGQAQRMSRSFMDELQREVDTSGFEESTREIRSALKPGKSLAKGKPLDSLLETLEGPEGAVRDPGEKTASAGENESSGVDDSEPPKL